MGSVPSVPEFLSPHSNIREGKLVIVPSVAHSCWRRKGEGAQQMRNRLQAEAEVRSDESGIDSLQHRIHPLRMNYWDHEFQMRKKKVL